MHFRNWVISPAPGLFHPSKFRLQENFIERTARASLLATLEVEYRDLTGGMLCALSISDSP
jgi:hypothetical protein